MNRIKTSNLLLFIWLAFIFIAVSISIVINGQKSRKNIDFDETKMINLSLNTFSNILIDGNIEILFEQAEKSAVFVNNENFNDLGVQIISKGEWLHIIVDSNTNIHKKVLSILVHCNKMNELSLKNKANFVCKQIKTESLNILSDNAKITIDTLLLDNFIYKGVGSCKFHTQYLKINNFEVNIAESASMQLNNTDLNLLVGSLTGKSQIHFHGNVHEIALELDSNARISKY